MQSVDFMLIAAVLATIVIVGCVAMLRTRHNSCAPHDEIRINLSPDEPLMVYLEEPKPPVALGDWSPWGGASSAPLPPGTLVDVQHRNGVKYFKQRIGYSIRARRWHHEADRAGDDIVAWRLHQLDEAEAAARRADEAPVPTILPAPEEVEADIAEQADRLRQLSAEADRLGSVLVQREAFHAQGDALRAASRFAKNPSERNFLSLCKALKEYQNRHETARD